MWESTLSTARFMVLYKRLGLRFMTRAVFGYTFTVTQDRDEPDTVYLVADRKEDKLYARIEGLDPRLVGVYRIEYFDKNLMSFVLKRFLPLPYFEELTSNGLRIDGRVQIVSSNEQGFSFVVLKRVKTRSKRALYVYKAMKKERGIVLYRKYADGTVSVVRVSDTVFFEKPVYKPWYEWLLLCSSSEECELLSENR